MQSCWDNGEAGRRYWECLNKFYKVPGEPICDFEVWIDEPCHQEYYKGLLNDLNDLCLKQWEREKQLKKEVVELKAKLKEVEEEKNKLLEQFKWLEQRIMGGSD